MSIIGIFVSMTPDISKYQNKNLPLKKNDRCSISKWLMIDIKCNHSLKDATGFSHRPPLCINKTPCSVSLNIFCIPSKF